MVEVRLVVTSVSDSGAVTRRWDRVLGGATWRFTVVNMPDGELRMMARKLRPLSEWENPAVWGCFDADWGQQRSWVLRPGLATDDKRCVTCHRPASVAMSLSTGECTFCR